MQGVVVRWGESGARCTVHGARPPVFFFWLWVLEVRVHQLRDCMYRVLYVNYSCALLQSSNCGSHDRQRRTDELTRLL